ncbi:hypothetical protein J2X36_004547 [Methylobacterium sp. BE186]|uniref:hypothetical protein n=1 Tax=Methylobacterium sp. BE186 TaxID=2817715 RepID=UPI00285B7E71|nr:hypothetical protein [Methylobacterium sp. BE186]MDR7039769.1 hypothetical protein [Methylobacterium sp. BE186]
MNGLTTHELTQLVKDLHQRVSALEQLNALLVEENNNLVRLVDLHEQDIRHFKDLLRPEGHTMSAKDIEKSIAEMEAQDPISGYNF